MEIRKIEEKDLKELSIFMKEVNLENGPINFNTEDNYVKMILKNFSTHPNYNLGVFENNKIIAFVIFTFSNSLSGYIHTIVVLKENRGKGIAKDLLLQVEGILIKGGRKFINLSVEKGNEKALDFYLKFGYKLIKTDQLEYSLRKKLSENQKATYKHW